tara:strand:+ start:2062 stop:2319 length:258 start_codon:yes stop_codon:yes gene_type:complete
MKRHLKVNVSIESLLRKRLVKFLKRENAFDKFCYNVKNHSGSSPETIFKMVSEDICISALFSWIETKEGYDYWSGLNIKFNKSNN